MSTKTIVGTMERRLLRTIGLTIGLAMVSVYITPTALWYEFWKFPYIKFYNLMTFLAIGFFSHLQMRLKGMNTIPVFFVFGAIGYLLVEHIKEYILVYNIPSEAMLIGGLIIFIISFKR